MDGVDEDTLNDLIGYLILLKIAKNDLRRETKSFSNL